MTKAFVFDMDGVIIASEVLWHKYLEEIWPELIGPEVAAVFRIPVGQTPLNIYAEAVKHGSKVSKETFLQKFEDIAQRVYQESPYTDKIDILGECLVQKGYKIGLVSSSPKNWIQAVLDRLSFGDKFEAIVSINDSQELKPKPHPGSYIEIIDKLGSRSETTIILEDSNSGIQAAKASGAFTIGLTANLLPNYMQHGADTYANTIEEIIQIVEDFDSKLVSI
ncbi:MAG: HAD family phosphatase [Candidatus Levybacteria bacterium]|nr:HAD family phosphatase [Candidatus Levybacteria bacterium]